MRGGSSPASAARMIATALSESACASAGSNGHDLVVERLAVLVERGEERDAELHVGHVELDLGEVDRLREPHAALHEVGPGLRVQRLVLPERRPADADRRAGDDHPVDVAAQPAAGGLEAELAAVGALVAQVEPGLAQPADRHRLEGVAGVEDAQDRPVEVGARVLRRVGDLVDQLPLAGLADPAAAEIVARGLAAVPRHQRRVDVGVHRIGRRRGRRPRTDRPRAVVEVDHRDGDLRTESRRPRTDRAAAPVAASPPGSRRRRPR